MPTKISQLPAGSALAGPELVPVVQNATTIQTTVTAIGVYIQTLFAASGGSALVSFLAAGAGAVARTLQSKNRDVISVKDYGAVGDGTTDDSAAFALALVAATGAALYVPTGTYKIITALTPGSNTLMYGDGAASVIACAQASSNLITATSKSNITFRSLKFTSSDGTHTPVVTFALCDQIRIEDCVWNCKLGSNIGTTALRMQGSTNVDVVGCQFFDANSSVYLDASGGTNSNYVKVLDCQFRYTTTFTTATPTGVYQFKCPYLLVDGCTFVNIFDNSAATAGYSVYEGDGTATSTTVTNCITVVGAAKPHVMTISSNSVYLSFTNNRFFGTALGAVSVQSYLVDARAAVSAVLIQGNYSEQGAIRVAGGASTATAIRVCEVLDNQIIKLEQNTSGIQIGLTGANYVDYFSVKNNTCSQTYASSIYIGEGNYGTVENNKCLNWNTQNKSPTSTYAYTAAIYWSGTSMRGNCRGNIIENNAVGVTGFPQYGIVADASPTLTLVDNKIVGAMTISSVLNLVQAGYPADNAFRIALQAGAQTLTEPLQFLAYWDDTGTGTLKLTVRNAANTTTRTANISFS